MANIPLTTDTFAPGFNRTPEGYIIFPKADNIRLRKHYFDPICFDHPAKADINMVQSIYRYVATPGETLMDIMSGTGTLMLAALEGYRVLLLELAPMFHYYQQLNRDKLVSAFGADADLIMLLLGDCREYLPLPVDHIIFSPPYAGTLNTAHKQDARIGATKHLLRAAAGGVGYNTDDYAFGPRNLGTLDPFRYNRDMAIIYRLCYESIRPGGTLTIVIQDMAKDGGTEELSRPAAAACVNTGFTLKDWFQRYSYGTPFKDLARSKGHHTIDAEDIIIMEKPA